MRPSRCHFPSVPRPSLPLFFLFPPYHPVDNPTDDIAYLAHSHAFPRARCRTRFCSMARLPTSIVSSPSAASASELRPRRDVGVLPRWCSRSRLSASSTEISASCKIAPAPASKDSICRSLYYPSSLVLNCPSTWAQCPMRRICSVHRKEATGTRDHGSKRAKACRVWADDRRVGGLSRRNLNV